MSFNPKHRSQIITNGRDRAPARAMLKAIGFNDDDLARPIIGVAHMWVETMPCNFNHRDLARQVKEGIRAAGATPMEFNTISISDGVTMGTGGIAATDPRKEQVAFEAGKAVVELLKRGTRPSDILTRQAFENAIAGVAATGGSTNAVLHLLAMAREAGVPLSIDDFDAISRRTPLIADLKPSGRHTAVEMGQAGGAALVAPEAATGGPIATIREGDVIVFDIEKRRLDIELSAEEIERRLAEWKPPAPRYRHGVFQKYAALVSSASEGAITRG